MRIRINRSLALLLTIAAVSVPSTSARAQGTDEKAKAGRAELGLEYDYLRSNAPPGNCGCFNMNGGGAGFAWPVKPGRFALAGDFSVEHVGSISSSGYELTLSTFTVGTQYRPPVPHWPVQPFGRVLVGVAHSSGSLVSGTNAGASNAGAAFAAKIGGGLDLPAGKHVSVRLFDADYLVTTFDNGSNNHQNNLHIGAGLILRF